MQTMRPGLAEEGLTMDQAERMLEGAEELWRTAAAGWYRTYDLAQQSSDSGVWAVEEAAWNSYRFAEDTRQLAWQLKDRVLSSSRRRVRESLMAGSRQPGEGSAQWTDGGTRERVSARPPSATTPLNDGPAA